jgi:hypothetical protein
VKGFFLSFATASRVASTNMPRFRHPCRSAPEGLMAWFTLASPTDFHGHADCACHQWCAVRRPLNTGVGIGIGIGIGRDSCCLQRCRNGLFSVLQVRLQVPVLVAVRIKQPLQLFHRNVPGRNNVYRPLSARKRTKTPTTLFVTVWRP